MNHSIQSGFGILKPLVRQVGLRGLWQRSRWTIRTPKSYQKKGVFSNWIPLVLAWRRRLNFIDQTMNILKSIEPTYLNRLHVYNNKSVSNQDWRSAVIFPSNTDHQENDFLREHAQTISVTLKPKTVMNLVFESRFVHSRHTAIVQNRSSNTRLHRQSNYFSKVQFLYPSYQKQLTQMSDTNLSNISFPITHRKSALQTIRYQSFNLAFPVLNTVNSSNFKMFHQLRSEKEHSQTGSIASNPEPVKGIVFEHPFIRSRYMANTQKWYSNTRLHRQSNYFSKVQFLYPNYQKQLTRLFYMNPSDNSPSIMHRTSALRSAYYQSLNLAFPVLNTMNSSSFKMFPQPGGEKKHSQTGSIASNPEPVKGIVFEHPFIRSRYMANTQKWYSNTRLHRQSNYFSKVQFLHPNYQQQLTPLSCMNPSVISPSITHRTSALRKTFCQSFNLAFPVSHTVKSGANQSNDSRTTSLHYVWRKTIAQVFRDEQSGQGKRPSIMTDTAVIHRNEPNEIPITKAKEISQISKNPTSSIDLPLLDKVTEEVIRRVHRRVRIDRERRGY
ncbi:hypothetical protein V144x_40560 [Gimesia aquarii]|uniref:Uncharacterized protein n=2 Tax=Gimesia aquarii TaxID=2527964 RepID=A0A517VZX1_9PLAN|nr:hypothetical protein V144x_40560 [Gimesia aquarii]